MGYLFCTRALGSDLPCQPVPGTPVHTGLPIPALPLPACALGKFLLLSEPQSPRLGNAGDAGVYLREAAEKLRECV